MNRFLNDMESSLSEKLEKGRSAAVSAVRSFERFGGKVDPNRVERVFVRYA